LQPRIFFLTCFEAFLSLPNRSRFFPEVNCSALAVRFPPTQKKVFSQSWFYLKFFSPPILNYFSPCPPHKVIPQPAVAPPKEPVWRFSISSPSDLDQTTPTPNVWPTPYNPCPVLRFSGKLGSPLLSLFNSFLKLLVLFPLSPVDLLVQPQNSPPNIVAFSIFLFLFFALMCSSSTFFPGVFFLRKSFSRRQIKPCNGGGWYLPQEGEGQILVVHGSSLVIFNGNSRVWST